MVFRLEEGVGISSLVSGGAAGLVHVDCVHFCCQPVEVLTQQR